MLHRGGPCSSWRSYSCLPQVLGFTWPRGRSLDGSPILRVGVLLRYPLLLGPRGTSRDGLAPPDLGRLHIVRDDVLDGPWFPRLRNSQWSGVDGEEGRRYARQDQTREHRDGQHVLLDLLAALGLGGPEDDALDAVVYPPTCLEGN